MEVLGLPLGALRPLGRQLGLLHRTTGTTTRTPLGPLGPPPGLLLGVPRLGLPLRVLGALGPPREPLKIMSKDQTLIFAWVLK